MTRAKINTYVELGCELDLKLLEDGNYHYYAKIKDIYLYGTYSYSKALKTEHIHITNSKIRRKKTAITVQEHRHYRCLLLVVLLNISAIYMWAPGHSDLSLIPLKKEQSKGGLINLSREKTSLTKVHFQVSLG